MENYYNNMYARTLLYIKHYSHQKEKAKERKEVVGNNHCISLKK